MNYYPVNLDIKNKKCLVVGGGKVGGRKIKTLLKCGAKVSLVSPEISESVLKIENTDLTIHKRDYKDSDLKGIFIVICATNNEKLNNKISIHAKERNILCNIADQPEACDFTLPSVVSRGDLIVTVSTGGKSPAFAKSIRKELDEMFGPEYADFLTIMGNIRKKLLNESKNPDSHKDIFEKIIQGSLLEMVKEKRVKDIDKLLLDILGEGYIFKNLLEVP
ncbi:MAG: bifunctional precorrin-2 dehydrogenase/sirohydrochlorin ferrochelatase [Desulfobacterales bacterium]|nr:bifunctional precorrin-2 dehydrogenase/sirohydrochlorin ferrochelatase [Desulfobacterales bacterium]MCP4162222.1 bifunctional precorrin-2 dehydrogenase/sirohydrochlorin ferrochelatase [Deltaproteobacteria bacterium]